MAKPKPATAAAQARQQAAPDDLLIVYAAPADFVPYARNSRKHTAAQITRLRASIREFGFTNPILTDGAMGILAGHARLEAAIAEGLPRVPHISLGHLPDAKRRAYVIADNRLAEMAEWDIEMLALEAAEAVAAGIDLETIGFSDDELRALLGDDPTSDQPGGEGEAQEGDDEAPALPKNPVARRGDVWLVGDHRVMCGSSTEDGDVDRLMDSQQAAMAFTDPPYNVDYAGGKTARSRIQNDALGEEFTPFLTAAFGNLLRITDGACYICMSAAELHNARAAFDAAGGHWSDFIIWAKNVWSAGFADYRRQHEPILYGWREGVKRHWGGGRDQSNVWEIPRVPKCDLHPTMKPVDLVIRAIKNSAPAGAIVVDLFGGSGTTAIACVRTHRHARIMELDPAYVDVILARLSDACMLPAILEGDGRQFAAIKRDGR